MSEILKGGIETDIYSENQTCPAVGYQAATVCVPVTVEPFAKAGATRTKCCGDVAITPGKQVCECCGAPEVQVVEQCCGCKLIVKQKLAVSIAIEYGTDVTAEDCKIDCSDPVSV